MQIAESARKHGIADEDILHAVAHAIVAVRIDADLMLYIGPSRTGALLEVIVVEGDDEDDDDVAIHAMPLREKFRHLVPRPTPKRKQ